MKDLLARTCYVGGGSAGFTVRVGGGLVGCLVTAGGRLGLMTLGDAGDAGFD